MKKPFLLILVLITMATINSASILADSVTNSEKISIISVKDSGEVRVVIHYDENYIIPELYEETDRIIKDYEKYTRKITKEIIKNTDISEGDIKFFNSAPMIEFSIEAQEDQIEYYKTLEKIAKIKSVKHIYIEDYLTIMEEGSLSSTTGSFINAPYTNSTYFKGTSVVIGMLETGYPDPDVNSLDTADIECQTTCSNSPYISVHATKVASIMVGDQGLAFGSKLKSARISGNTLYDIDNSVTWLINKGADVINLSMGVSYDLLTPGLYTSADAYFDSVISNQKVTVVKSSGNLELAEHITSPGRAYNIITVGALSQDRTSRYGTSAYEVNSSEYDIIKPTISAVGTYDFYPYGNLSGDSGTSFSAAAVSATIACMMNVKSEYKTNPWLVTSVLVANANRELLEPNYTFSEYGIDKYVGAGELDVYKSIMNYSKTSSGYVSSSNSYNSIVHTKRVYLNQNKTLRIAMYWNRDVEMINLGTEQYDLSPNLTFKIKVTHDYDGLYCQTNTNISNFLVMECNIYSNSYYDIDVIMTKVYNASYYGDKTYWGLAYYLY